MDSKEVIVLVKNSLKTLKIESWKPDRIVLRYVLIFNWKITLLASKIMPEGKLFPMSVFDFIPERIETRFMGIKFTIMRYDIIELLNKEREGG